MSKVQRWIIPNDGKLHEIKFKGGLGLLISYVEIDSKLGGIEFWTYEYPTPEDPAKEVTRRFQVYGTGVEIPPGFVLVGTTPRTQLLKQLEPIHLFEKMV